jgi:glucose-1-phosphate thymidylyltransferase
MPGEQVGLPSPLSLAAPGAIIGVRRRTRILCLGTSGGRCEGNSGVRLKKGIILSGGRGTRLRPITHTSAKQLVPIANKPILFYAIETVRDAGISDIGIVVGETRREIEDAVGDGSKWGLKITYIDQPEPLGLAHAVSITEEFVAGERFVVYLGDNLLRGGIRSVADEFAESDADAQIFLVHVPNPGDFGVAEIEDGGSASPRVVRLTEKPKEPKTDLALAGIYFFGSAIFDAAAKIRPSFRNELEITDAIQYLIDSGRKVVSHVITGWWKDTGKLEDILEANRIVLEDISKSIEGAVDAGSKIEGKVRIDKGAQIRHSVVRGPAVIGAGAEIEDSYIGPFTSIAGGARILGSEIEHSIVLERSSILSVGGRIVDSLIGKDVVVSRDSKKPEAYRFMLGDSSRVNVF